MNRRTTIWALLVGGLLGPAAATAQPAPSALPTSNSAPAEPARAESVEDIELLELNVPMVVTASRHEQKITAVPYAISVITAEDIRRAGARSIPDALRLAPGVDVADLTYGNWAVSPRGFHGFFASKTLVLVDGRGIFDSVMSGTLWGTWPFQLEDIQRIEVIRGPGGVIWGANAVNGVINIITKDPATQTGLTVTGGGGSRGTYRQHTGYAFQDGKLRMRVSGELEGSDGFLGPTSVLGNFRDDFQAVRGGVHAIYEQGPNDTFTLSAGSAVVDGNWPVPPMLFQRTLPPRAQSNYLLGRWTHRVAADNTVELTGFVNDYQIMSGVAWSDYHYDQFALQLRQTFHPADNHTVTWGVDSVLDVTDATGADPYMLSQDVIHSGSVGVYGQDEWRFAPRWALNLGGRVDYDAYGGFQPSSRAALSYELTKESMIYAAVSRAFQMRPAAGRFVDFPLADPFLHVVSDRNMDPETLIAYELGYRGRFFDRLDVSLNGFWHDYDDLLASNFGLGPPGLMKIMSGNDASISLYGVELDLKYAVTRSLTLLGNYTFQRPDSSPSTFGSDVITPPEHKFMTGARYAVTDALRLGAHLYYVDAVTAPSGSNPIARRSIDPYFRLDLNAEYEFWKDRASVTVGVSNLLDPRHPEGGSGSLADGEVPRMIYAELRMTLK